MTLFKLLYITGFLLPQWVIHIGKPSGTGIPEGSAVNLSQPRLYRIPGTKKPLNAKLGALIFRGFRKCARKLLELNNGLMANGNDWHFLASGC